MLGNLFGPKKIIPETPAQSGDVPVGPTDSSTLNSSLTPTTRHDVGLLSHLDTRTSSVLSHAQAETQRLHQSNIEPEQILLGLLFDAEIFALLENFGVNGAKLSTEIQSKEVQGSFTGQPTLSIVSKKLFDNAGTISKNHESDFISPEDLLLALVSEASNVATILQGQGVDKEKITQKLEKTVGVSAAGKHSVLAKFGIDLTEEAKAGKLDPVSGRDRETERLVHILLRRSKNNPVIIGEAGVGKTAVVEGLAQFIASGQIPKDLQGKRIIQLDLSSLIAGASHRGEFEERLKNVIKETQASNGEIILFIDEIHTLIGAGDTGGALDASNIIKPYLARGQLRIIGTTTITEYRKYIEKDKAFERRFQPVLVEEPSEEVAVGMLATLKAKYEKFHSVVLPEDSLKEAVHLSKKYIGERYLPDKAVDLLDEASADVKLQIAAGKRQDNVVKKEDIEKVVSSWTGIPITKLTEDESQKLLHMEDVIHNRLIGQQEAVKSVAEAVRRGRIGLSATNRPIASFIFLGPTGVGKTELAKTLAEIMFGKEESMVRLDMSEYMEKHEVAKLIGAPPGYVGYEEGGQLTEAVRKKPYSIVLLDEVEKAHPDVFNILLQLLEDGRLTDNKGNTISFRNTIVICTSNIGSALIQQHLTQAKEHQEAFEKEFKDLKSIVTAELIKFFRPELLNRFDEVVIFEPLRKEHMSAIAKLEITKTHKLLKNQQLDLQISDAAITQLAVEGYDPVYGARPLRRLVQSAIENPISLCIIKKEFISGDSILVDYDTTQQNYTFKKGQVAPPVPGQVGANVSVPTNGVQPTVPLSVQETSLPIQEASPLPPSASNGLNGTQMQPVVSTSGS